MALVEGCKHQLEITIPVEEVDRETARVVEDIRKRVRLPGFRPGKVPLDLIRKRYSEDIRQQVVENLVPRFFRQRAEKEDLQVVGNPSVTDVHFHRGEPLRFKAEFEVSPSIELGEYRGLTVVYEDPVVTGDDVARRIEELRIQKAEYRNLDPRPAADGDFAVVALESLAGVEGEPVKQDEIMLHVGDESTLPAFSENLRGMTPGEEKEFDVSYPEDYAGERLAGRTVRFRAKLTAIRERELPELDDAFAQDLGDYQNVEELREAVRKAIFREREFLAQQLAKSQLVDKLVESHQFPVPEAFVDRQIENTVAQALADRGVDPRKIKLDWEKLKESQKDRAVRDVKASLLLDRIADREAIYTTNEEIDRELQRLARQEREPVAAMRMRFEKDGTLRRMALRIRTEKTMNFLFEQARKESGNG